MLTWFGAARAEEPVAQADALVKYAHLLGGKGEAVRIGPEGLTIEGGTLKGAEIVRPAVALARAAELYAEAAADKNSTILLDQALQLWKSLDDPRTPVPYLRTYSREKKAQNPSFALYCEVKLAGCYVDQGDPASARALLEPYAGQDASNKMVAFAKATYASCLLIDGDLDHARQLAQDVLDKVPPEDFTYKVADGYNVALNVLASLPSTSKAGSVGGTTAEAKLLAGLEGNPRRYLQLAGIVNGTGDKRKAIYYWDEYRKRFPNEEGARLGAMQAANAFEELKQPDKAIEYYLGISVQYADLDEGWRSVLKASSLLEKANKTKDALNALADSERRIRSAQGQAWILATEARMLVQNQATDQATEKYVGLLIKYGDQDAAKDAVKNLRKIAPQVKNWRYFTQLVQNWLGGKYGRAAQVGNAEMNVSDASQLRRLALAFYVENNDVYGGIGWLKTLGMQSQEKERNWIIRDEAWLDAQIAQRTATRVAKSNHQEIANAVKLGLSAWQIAPDSDEGSAGLKAAQSIVTQTAAADKAGVRQFIRELEALRGGDSAAEITQLLVPLYEIVGDQKSRDALRQAADR